MKKVTDIDGYALSYTYTARKDGIPARISSVTESDGRASGGKLTFEYARNQTTVTDRQGNVQRMQFNTWGNRISVQDGQGRVQYAGFATDKGAATAKGNQLTLSSQMQNTVGNRIKNSNFDLDNLWNTSGETISCAIVSGTAYSGKEVFGTSYEYDADGNVVKSTDVQQQSTTCTYDDDQNLKSISMPTGESVTYTYDDYHNVLTATTGTGVVYTYDYDAYGNTKSVTITDSSSGESITASAEYSDGGNRLVSSTDALGQTTTYSYTANTNVLDYVLYPNDTAATKTDYSYDSMYRMLTGVTTTMDTGLTLSASYEYTDDLLTKLSTPSTDYTFTYGNFGLRTKVKAGSLTLASYTYEDATNYLKKLAYGNGDSVEYTYNQQGQVTGQTYEDGDVVTYHYGNSGELASVTDSDSGITQHYIYDLIGRPGQYRETGGEWEVNQTYTYSSKNQLTRIRETIGDRTCTTDVAYDSEGRVSTYRKNYSRVTYSYDYLDRLSSMVTHHTYGDGKDILTETYEYTDPITGKTSGQVSEFTTKSIGNYDVTYEYSYDDNGNIVSVKSGSKTTTYTYDTANQLLRENNQAAGKTWVWTYDNAGNILSKKEYAYTTGTLGTVQDTVSYTYGDSAWGDLLTAWDGQTITYDGIGNPTSDGTWNYTWEHGRELASMTSDGTTWTYTYNADGLRTSRTNGSTTYEYIYTGSQLTQMTMNENGTLRTMYFIYDASGPIAIKMTNGTSSTTYYYVKNIQGDIIAIVNKAGTAVVTYTYDAWGNILSIGGEYKNGLGVRNPLRYRGYVYDTETQFYYLQSRYYDPEIGRFINADSYASTGQGILGNNMFAYCLNSPVHLVDSMGNTPTEAVDTDGDGEIDYYRYDYEYSYTVYLPYHNYSYEATASGSVYFFPATPIDYFENEENIPDGFNKYTDLLVADIPGAENITFYAYQAQYISARSYNIIAKILMQYDVDFNRGFNRSMESLVSEWHYHMLFGGYLGISRSANVDFDKNGDGDTLGECVMKIINAIAGK